MTKKKKLKSLYGFELPEMNAKTSSIYLIDKIHTIWKENKNSRYLKHTPMFNIAHAHLPRDSGSSYYIIDKNNIIPEVGSQRLSVTDLSYNTRKKIVRDMVSKGWLKKDASTSSVRLCQADFTISPKKFFKENGHRWKEILDMWCTENLSKDVRLVDSFKSMQIPFLYGDPSYWQPYNAHSIWLTNTGTGKSMFNEIAGEVSSADLSVAGLFGANIGNTANQQVGALSGYGISLIDEVEQLSKHEYSSDVLVSLLSYMEQGKVERKLRIPIRCEGTKAIIFASNPKSNDPLHGVFNFLTLMQSDSEPARFGRRIAFFLVGNDYQRITVTKPIPLLRVDVLMLIKNTVLLYFKTKIEKILKTNMEWINDAEGKYNDIQRSIELKSRACPNETVRAFILGLSYSLQRLRMCALRIAILENLDKIVCPAGCRFPNNKFKKDVEKRFLLLVSYNLKSIDMLISGLGLIEPSKKCAIDMKRRFPKMSLRDIAFAINVNRETVRNWCEK